MLTKITDFGVARLLDPKAKTKKATDMLPGTKDFMPPEFFSKSCQYDAKVDVFSFGCVIISVISHQWPSPEEGKVLKDGKFVTIDEFDRRAYLMNDFNEQEKATFITVIRECLQDMAKERFDSSQLVEEMNRTCTKLKVDGITSRLEEQKVRNDLWCFNMNMSLV